MLFADTNRDYIVHENELNYYESILMSWSDNHWHFNYKKITFYLRGSVINIIDSSKTWNIDFSYYATEYV